MLDSIFNDTQQEYKDMKGKVMEELKKAFRPEFLNRIDETIVFHALEKKHLKEIVTLMANQLIKRLKEQEIALVLTECCTRENCSRRIRS